LVLFGLAVLVEIFFRRSYANYTPPLPLAGLFFIVEWHLAWAAVSGMETLLYILLVIATLGLLIVRSRQYLLLGILTGVSVWVRPDGLALLGPLLLYAILTEQTMAARTQGLMRIAFGFLALFVPYLLFNLALSGTPLPNTFYAKQAEYAEWQARPFDIRLFFFAIQFFAGPSIVLLPGFIQKTISAIRRREWGILLSVVWMLGYILIYLSRLPVYQHGRYIMPAMGLFFLIGLMGFYEFLPASQSHLQRRMRRVLLSAVVLFNLGFSAYGAYTYGQDVGLIESEMVASAKWAAQNIPPGALIAAHDIGALGFFDSHPLIDLAGLISPEVVPFIRDEAKLADFMDKRGAKYLIAFPSWYHELPKRGTLIFTTNGRFVDNLMSPDANMAIYRWNNP
jgi:hypothetical protein